MKFVATVIRHAFEGLERIALSAERRDTVQIAAPVALIRTNDVQNVESWTIVKRSTGVIRN